jgi:hypothetical protein
LLLGINIYTLWCLRCIQGFRMILLLGSSISYFTSGKSK